MTAAAPTYASSDPIRPPLSPDKQRSYAEIVRRSWRLGGASEMLGGLAREVVARYLCALSPSPSRSSNRWTEFVYALDALVRESTAYAAFGALRAAERDDYAYFQRILAENADLLAD